MNDRINKTSICSIVFLDIIDYSKKPDAEQIEVKNQFNALINAALKDIAQNDRIILDSGDGAAIAYHGSPEDALFMALDIRDSILKSNILSAMPLFVRFGINLGPVRVVKDINGRPNIIGDGINVAQRIMSFAKPNQILVSRSYYEITSRLTQEISQMFDYFGVKHDKHVREHEVYSVRSLKDDTSVSEGQSENQSDHLLPSSKFAVFNKINGNHIAPVMFVLVALFAIAKLALAPNVPVAIATKPSQIAQKLAIASNEATADKTTTKTTSVMMDKKTQDKLTKENTKKAAQKIESGAKPQNGSVVQHKEVAAVTPQAKKEGSHEKSGWTTLKESVKQGAVSKCTQAQISMNQCRE